MGAGDLNVKKSWHPRLQKNQEKVWMQEQEAEAERKKLEELRKEREQERQMQELQRIHEAAGGKRRAERVEWMYATPASSSGPSEAELEDYLLGKKRVDKLLQGNEAKQLMRDAVPTAQEDPDEVRASRDMAIKIREDPLFAIKKQEQAMRDMLMKDPTRHREKERRSYHLERYEGHGRSSRSRRDDEFDRDRRAHCPSRRLSKSPERRALSEAEREAKLAEMKHNAQQITQERNAMIEHVQAEEKMALEQEEAERNKTRDSKQWKQDGAPGRAAFLLDQQRDLWGKQSGGMDLHERLRRSQHALEAISDDTVG
ncbi:RNA-splicing factor [Malassezia equina]|uniref:RNA-splicing factor n=1 Tax=Malassezia equina TaxID=1381935 RepID=A0AAF0J280_9BASI|nr:RNA-splicing factor [Malassezia equina]